MKKLLKASVFSRGVAIGIALISCATVAKAIPYASCVTNVTLGGSNYVQFVMNEAGANVSVIFEDTTSNLISSSCPIGTTNFFLGTHTSYQIYATKLGNGTPAQITTDTSKFNQWPTPRGVDIIKNPKNGAQFGRIFIANATFANTTSGGSRGQGLYALNADCTDSYLGKGTNATFGSTFTTASTSSPYKVSVNPDDNTVDVADFSTANATVFKFDPDFNTSANYVVLNPVGENQGFAAGTHGDPTGVFTMGSIAQGNLVVFTADPDLGAPANAQLGTGGNGPTAPGTFNNIFRYDIGAGPLPWNQPPVFAVNVCLPGFQDSQTLSVTFGPDTNKIYAQCFRANLSDGCIQVFDRTSGNILYDSLHGGADIFGSSYAQARVSPDGRFLAAITVGNVIHVVNLTNGIPDESSLITIANTASTVSARGLAFDAADNVYEVSQGQALLRGFSLGITGTAITGNDVTGTNGTFQLLLPATTATVAATTPVASQNYINSSPAGTPIPGVFTVSLSTNNNSTTVPVTIALSGTAVFNSNYTINSGTDSNGVIISNNLVTFPAGPCPTGSNWTANVQIIPTAIPKIGPSTTVTIKLVGGANYFAGTPTTSTLSIANTGPQFVFLSAASAGTTMNRGIPGDYAKFTLTRWGDTNGPNNVAGSVNPLSYTVTNFTYLGSAVYPVDYLAQSQRIDPSGNGVPSSPATGTPGIVINPGDVSITCVVGDPVAHTNLNNTPTNVTVGINLTNNPNGTNLTSLEGYSYFGSNNTVTVTELDNTVGTEVVIWSDALTNSLDNTWNLVYANTNLATTTVLPALVPNYTNGQTEAANGGPNDFEVAFGNPVANDSVPPSPVMAANGWTTALRMTANKDGQFSPAAVNVYPQGQNFIGNVALRFSMYLSLYDFARGTTAAGTDGREFALFGIDHRGTNANWRPTTAVLANTGSGQTNCDGQWFAVDADNGSLTPADFDGFSPPALPNGGTSDIVSSAGSAETGVFKNPPFTDDEVAAGGNPANQWVDVDVEKVQSNNVYNISMFIDRSSVISSFLTTNTSTTANFTNGTIMLGYEDPVGDVSDQTAFVYFSNVRVVELSPFLVSTAKNVLALNGATVSFTNVATYATIPGITNQWFKGNTGPVTLLQTDTNSSTNITSVLTLASVTTGTNYYAVASDSAGSITAPAGILEVISGPNNVTANSGAKATFTVTPTGQSAPTSYQWKTNGVNLVNGIKYTNVTTASLGVSNVTSSDTLVTYACTVVNAAGTVTTPAATLTLVFAPSGASVTPPAQTNIWGSPASFTVTTTGGTSPFTYGWKHGGTNVKNGGTISGATNSTLTISAVTQADAGSYTVGVTNGAGNNTSPAATLTVIVPPPTFSGAVALNSGNVALSFTSTNNYDTSNAFTLQSSPIVTGPFTNAPGTITGSNGSFQITVPQTTDTNEFYRLLHAN